MSRSRGSFIGRGGFLIIGLLRLMLIEVEDAMFECLGSSGWSSGPEWDGRSSGKGTHN